MVEEMEEEQEDKMDQGTPHTLHDPCSRVRIVLSSGVLEAILLVATICPIMLSTFLVLLISLSLTVY